MSPRADAVRNRQKLVDAARASFDEHGVDVPLERIAKRAGVSIGTLYNHFADRGELVDAVLPDRLAQLDALAAAADAEPDAWTAFAGFLDALIAAQARDRTVNEAVARGAVGEVDLVAECGRAGGAVLAVLDRAHTAGVVRRDFGFDDLATLMVAVANVIALHPGDDTVWRRHLGFVLAGIRTGPARDT
ncbi:TetR/AcrR family transcriptional regulator [Tsukamurella sp. 1534]|uniref:TetR/AcrR family transcriptional regulator n=1 Tax=Tsukamurella sp. 1534 TaxID=1151061 RepID=UPI00192BD380|nr:TetR family transcriptional regulator [Tsukamurella sp. 1534]